MVWSRIRPPLMFWYSRSFSACSLSFSERSRKKVEKCGRATSSLSKYMPFSRAQKTSSYDHLSCKPAKINNPCQRMQAVPAPGRCRKRLTWGWSVYWGPSRSPNGGFVSPQSAFLTQTAKISVSAAVDVGEEEEERKSLNRQKQARQRAQTRVYFSPQSLSDSLSGVLYSSTKVSLLS